MASHEDERILGKESAGEGVGKSKVGDNRPLGSPPSFVDGIAFIRANPHLPLEERAREDRNRARLIDSIDHHRN